MPRGGEFKFEIVRHFGVVSESSRGWNKELNLVSFNDAQPKYDIRDWDPNHEKNGQRSDFDQGRIRNFARFD